MTRPLPPLNALRAFEAAARLGSVSREYTVSGKLLEKYDVVERRPGGGGEYPNQDGFGWTNGVTRALLDRNPAPSLAP